MTNINGSYNKTIFSNDEIKKNSPKSLAIMSLAALGVVFGDIGTSPLYALRECFHGEYGISVSPGNILGVLSLMFWALIIIVTLKYLTFVFRADNHGEGGVIALTALLRSKDKNRGKVKTIVFVGLFAACLLYGDGMITPAISVLSAVEGIKIITPVFTSYVIPLTIAILACLFLIQHRGTARIGRLFGPIILVWFIILALLGGMQIFKNPGILAALMPWHGVKFLIINKFHGFVVLGAVFLVVTGTEALYADMGHFGKIPIRITWFALVLPSLLLNYFGQGALLLSNPDLSGHPFYALVPSSFMIPMVMLATISTIIASQAVITGAFSLTKQAIQLGFFPRMRITHTSISHIGQIYIAPINWMLMICTIALVAGFRSSTNLAAAYGVAVTTTMIITTCMFYLVATEKWGWSRITAGFLSGFFILVDLSFFLANFTKIFHGAWFPLAIGGVFFTCMITWEKGRRMLGKELKSITSSFEMFKKNIDENPPQRINGQAVYLTGNPDIVPVTLTHNLKHNKILHSDIVLMHIQTEEIPRVPNKDKVQVEKLGGGFYRIIASFGFMEMPGVENILALAREKGIDFKTENASFFMGREHLIPAEKPAMFRWQSGLFLLMSRNALDAASYFDIPADQIIEVGIQFHI